MYILLLIGFVWLFILFYHWYVTQKHKVEEFNALAETHGLEKRKFSVGVVFHCMMWLALAGMALQVINAFSRWLKIIESDYRTVFFDSLVWEFRCLPFLIVLYVLCIKMTERYINGNKIKK